jgi:16S rRNA (cytidine1402-2'-O)-methyltransferase
MATLFVIATPIGNLEDVTRRALRVLAELQAVACEDTRRTRMLLARYEIHAPRTLLSYREATEGHGGSRILGLLGEGIDVGLVSDAGYPGISDAGYRIICSAIEAGHRLEVLPGAGAVTPALISSGLPTSSFTFKGFPPRKPGPLRRFLEMEKDLPHTLVFYESPLRVAKLLAAVRDVLGDRRAAVCVELTKKFERTLRGYAGELAARLAGKDLKGEVTVVVAGANPKFSRAGDEDNADGGDAEET